jgi:hypothetical protein
VGQNRMEEIRNGGIRMTKAERKKKGLK